MPKPEPKPGPVRPTQVKVGAVRFVIEWDGDALDTVGDNAGKWLFGDSSERHARIRIRPDLPHDIGADTLLHELLHMALAVGACSLESEVKYLEPEHVEERAVSAAAPVLLGVLRDNPEVTAWLLHAG